MSTCYCSLIKYSPNIRYVKKHINREKHLWKFSYIGWSHSLYAYISIIFNKKNDLKPWTIDIKYRWWDGVLGLFQNGYGITSVLVISQMKTLQGVVLNLKEA